MIESYKELSEIEKKRYNISVHLLLQLFSKENREEVLDLLEERTNKIIILDDYSDTNEEGYIEEVEEKNGLVFDVAYPKYDSKKTEKSIHASIHELIHLIGTPNKKTDLKKTKGKECFGGLKIVEYSDTEGYIYYGNVINEGCDEILTKIALSRSTRINNNYTADDVIMDNKVEFKSGYKPIVPIVRLLAYAMNNEFNRTYTDILDNDEGLVDKTIILFNQDKSKYYKLPINDLFYGIVVDPLHSEKRYDMYSLSIGEYKKMNKKLDEAFKSNRISTKLIKETIISITNMFYNKIYLLKKEGIISEKTYNETQDEYNFLLATILEYYKKEYNANIIFTEDEIDKMMKALSISKTEDTDNNSFGHK